MYFNDKCFYTYCRHRHKCRTKKQLPDIGKRIDSLETVVQQQIQHQNDSMRRILELLQQQQQQQCPTVIADDGSGKPAAAERTVTLDASEMNESHD